MCAHCCMDRIATKLTGAHLKSHIVGFFKKKESFTHVSGRESMIREVWGGYYSGLIGISPWHVAVILLPASECDVGSAVISITLHFPSFAGQHQPINTLLFFLLILCANCNSNNSTVSSHEDSCAPQHNEQLTSLPLRHIHSQF